MKRIIVIVCLLSGLLAVGCGGGGGDAKKTVDGKVTPDVGASQFAISVSQKSLDDCTGSIAPSKEKIIAQKGSSLEWTLSPKKEGCDASVTDNGNAVASGITQPTDPPTIIHSLSDIQKNHTLVITWHKASREPQTTPTMLSEKCEENGLTCDVRAEIAKTTEKLILFPNMTCQNADSVCTLPQEDVLIKIQFFADPNCKGNALLELSSDAENRDQILPIVHIRKSHPKFLSFCAEVSSKITESFGGDFRLPIQVVIRHRGPSTIITTTQGPKPRASDSSSGGEPKTKPPTAVDLVAKPVVSADVTHTVTYDPQEFTESAPGRFTLQKNLAIEASTLDSVTFYDATKPEKFATGHIPMSFLCEGAGSDSPCTIVFRDISDLGGRKISSITVSPYSILYGFSATNFQGTRTCLAPGILNIRGIFPIASAKLTPFTQTCPTTSADDQKKITELKTAAAKLNTDIANLNASINSLNAAITQTKNQIAPIDSQIAYWQQRQKSVRPGHSHWRRYQRIIVGLQQKRTPLANQLTGQSTQLTQQTNQLSNLKKQLEATTQQLNNLLNQYPTLPVQ